MADLAQAIVLFVLGYIGLRLLFLAVDIWRILRMTEGERRARGIPDAPR